MAGLGVVLLAVYSAVHNIGTSKCGSRGWELDSSPIHRSLSGLVVEVVVDSQHDLIKLQAALLHNGPSCSQDGFSRLVARHREQLGEANCAELLRARLRPQSFRSSCTKRSSKTLQDVRTA